MDVGVCETCGHYYVCKHRDQQDQALCGGWIPNADLANEFRVDELEAVMISVDKWFDDNDPRLKNNPATRAADAREIALKAIESEQERIENAFRTWMLRGQSGGADAFLSAIRSRK